MLGRMVLIFAMLGIASPAAAESGGAGDFYWQLANFALLLVVLVVLLRKPIGEYFRGRRAEVKSELDAAGELLAQAEARHSEWQHKLIDLDTELDSIRATSRERAQQEHDQVIADAHAAAERIKRDATAAVDHELRRGKAALQREASDLAVELAEKILREQILESDRDRLADEFISQLERSGAAGR
jgi:F-type H+-transporting ATPase subunit b